MAPSGLIHTAWKAMKNSRAEEKGQPVIAPKKEFKRAKTIFKITRKMSPGSRRATVAALRSPCGDPSSDSSSAHSNPRRSSQSMRGWTAYQRDAMEKRMSEGRYTVRPELSDEESADGGLKAGGVMLRSNIRRNDEGDRTLERGNAALPSGLRSLEDRLNDLCLSGNTVREEIWGDMANPLEEPERLAINERCQNGMTNLMGIKNIVWKNTDLISEGPTPSDGRNIAAPVEQVAGNLAPASIVYPRAPPCSPQINEQLAIQGPNEKQGVTIEQVKELFEQMCASRRTSRRSSVSSQISTRKDEAYIFGGRIKHKSPRVIREQEHACPPSATMGKVSSAREPRIAQNPSKNYRLRPFRHGAIVESELECQSELESSVFSHASRVIRNKAPRKRDSSTSDESSSCSDESSYLSSKSRARRNHPLQRSVRPSDSDARSESRKIKTTYTPKLRPRISSHGSPTRTDLREINFYTRAPMDGKYSAQRVPSDRERHSRYPGRTNVRSARVQYTRSASASSESDEYSRRGGKGYSDDKRYRRNDSDNKDRKRGDGKNERHRKRDDDEDKRRDRPKRDRDESGDRGKRGRDGRGSKSDRRRRGSESESDASRKRRDKLRRGQLTRKNKYSSDDDESEADMIYEPPTARGSTDRHHLAAADASVRRMTFHQAGKATEGYRSRTARYKTVDAFLQDLTMHFANIGVAHQIQGEIRALQQGVLESANDYGMRAEKLYNRLRTIVGSAPDISEFDRASKLQQADTEALEQFLLGLKTPLNFLVQLKQPKTLNQAMSYAIEYEGKQGTRNTPCSIVSPVNPHAQVRLTLTEEAKPNLTQAISDQPPEKSTPQNNQQGTEKLCSYCETNTHNTEECRTLMYHVKNKIISRPPRRNNNNGGRYNRRNNNQNNKQAKNKDGQQKGGKNGAKNATEDDENLN